MFRLISRRKEKKPALFDRYHYIFIQEFNLVHDDQY